jgi:hypothetical protein
MVFEWTSNRFTRLHIPNPYCVVNSARDNVGAIRNERDGQYQLSTFVDRWLGSVVQPLKSPAKMVVPIDICGGNNTFKATTNFTES